ncbi:uncharacterized protein LOC143708823 [Siphateles boraxobius]|uniref:uncharacterized protein LOC143708823 n=1 Tax=Siphateles boraxobius TaxID=180520 RepID=UPI004062DE32
MGEKIKQCAKEWLKTADTTELAIDPMLQNLDKNIDMMRDVVLRCLICYLGEKEDYLIQEYNCDNGDILQHIMKIAICKRDYQKDFSIILEGMQVMAWLGKSGKSLCSFFLDSRMH